MEILYGIEGKYVNVTHLAHVALLKGKVIEIPQGDDNRAQIFGDPIPNVLKHIKIIENDKATIVLHNESRSIITNKSTPTPQENAMERKLWWNSLEAKKIVNAEQKLRELHRYIHLEHGSKSDEYPEQLMVMKYLKCSDTVLELGGNIGRNSCIIASILDDDKRLVSVECDPGIAEKLQANRDLNGFTFNIEASAISRVPLIQKGWDTFVSELVFPGYKKVPTITFEELKEKYKLKFNVLVVDCEGAMYQILRDEPTFLDGIETIIMENDFHDITKKQYVDSIFKKQGFQVVYTEGGGWGPCRDFFFQVFSKL